MKLSRLRSLLHKLKTNELVDLIQQLNCMKNYMNEMNFEEKLDQKDIIEKLLDIVSRNSLIDDVYEEIELINACTMDKKRLWTVYEFQSSASNAAFPDITAEEIFNNIKKSFHDAVDVLFECTIACKQQHGTLWFRFSIMPRTSKRKSPLIIYMVCFAFSSFVILSTAPDEIRDAILAVIAEEFNFSKRVKGALTGYSIQSLMQLVIDQENLKYKLDLYFPNPLLNSTLSEQNSPSALDEQGAIFVTRPLTIWSSSSGSKNINFIFSVSNLKMVERAFTSAKTDGASIREQNNKRLRQEYLLKTFGPHRQPKLQSLVYEIETTLKNQKGATEKIDFNYTVTFSGPSVLDGMQEMVAEGIADYPLPKHLTEVHKSKVNCFKLSKKK